MYVSWSVFLFVFCLSASIVFFGDIATDCPCKVSSVDPYFYICFYLSQYPRILPLILRVYVRPFTCVSLSHILSLNVYSSVRIYHHSFLVRMYVYWSVFLSLFFLWFLCLCSAILSQLYVYRYISYSAFLSISLYLCLSQCPGILSVIFMYVNKRVQLAQCLLTL